MGPGGPLDLQNRWGALSASSEGSFPSPPAKQESAVAKTDSREPRPRPPALGSLLALPAVAELVRNHGHQRVLEALRECRTESLAAPARGGARPGAPNPELEIAARAALWLGPSRRLRPVINGTGVVVHTNLGRAPIAAAAARQAAALGSRYSNLELDLDSGRRGDRQDLLGDLLQELTGAEAAMVVNNGAAAVLLALTALCRGKEVVVSRGEAIEIGGGFRIPEILRLSGARLVDVGTTNRTRLGDYAQAIGPRTAAFLRVHPSNFRIQGFTSRAPVGELAELAHRRGLLLLEDLGSGLLPPVLPALSGEEPLRRSIAAGVDVVVASGDKLLGASQAGLIVGREQLLRTLRRHPLARALRPDKLQLSVLEETLLCYANPGRLEEIPVWQMLRVRPEQLRRRALGWAERLRQAGAETEVVSLEGTVGGGAAPGSRLDSWGILVRHPRPRRLRARLLRTQPPVLCLERPGGAAIDARTVLPGEDEELLSSLLEALRPDGEAGTGA